MLSCLFTLFCLFFFLLYNILSLLFSLVFLTWKGKSGMSFDMIHVLFSVGGWWSVLPMQHKIAISKSKGLLKIAQDLEIKPHWTQELYAFYVEALKISPLAFIYMCLAKVEMMVPFGSVAQSYPTLCDPMNRSMPDLPVQHQLLEFTQTHVHWVGDAIQPSHPLSSPSPPASNPSQHQGLFQWVNSLHEVAKVLEFQLQHQSSQWTPRTDLL